MKSHLMTHLILVISHGSVLMTSYDHLITLSNLRKRYTYGCIWGANASIYLFMVGCDIVVGNGGNMRDCKRTLGFYSYTIIIEVSQMMKS
jgi:hypothetical protein